MRLFPRVLQGGKIPNGFSYKYIALRRLDSHGWVKLGVLDYTYILAIYLRLGDIRARWTRQDGEWKFDLYIRTGAFYFTQPGFVARFISLCLDVSRRPAVNR